MLLIRRPEEALAEKRLQDAGSDVLEWGMSGSPFIYKDTVIIDAGGDKGKAVIAYDRTSGEIVWSSGNHKAAIRLHGWRQLPECQCCSCFTAMDLQE